MAIGTILKSLRLGGKIGINKLIKPTFNAAKAAWKTGGIKGSLTALRETGAASWKALRPVQKKLVRNTALAAAAVPVGKGLLSNPRA